MIHFMFFMLITAFSRLGGRTFMTALRTFMTLLRNFMKEQGFDFVRANVIININKGWDHFTAAPREARARDERMEDGSGWMPAGVGAEEGWT